MTSTNRETWLNDLAALMAPRFEELGFKLPAFRVSIGFTGGGKTSKESGECWHASASADKRFEIFIRPDMADPMELAAILAHELNHAAVGFKHKHKGAFASVMAALGFQRPFTSSIAGDGFKAWAQPFIDQIGPLPHAVLMFKPGQRPDAGGAGVGCEEDEGGGSSNDKKKQSTRMLKACCSECGYTVRLSKKWAKELGAQCPQHSGMEIEGLEADEDGED